MVSVAQPAPREVELEPPASLNPLALSGTAMPPGLLLIVKLLVVCFFASGEWTRLPEPFLPYLGVLDDVGSPAAFAAGLKVVFALAAVLLLTNRRPRAASLVLGLVLVLAMLASRSFFENNRFFLTLLFLLCGLSDRTIGPRLVQLQVVVLYFGAALNKLLDVDWRSGQYFDYIASVSPLSHAYSQVSGILPGLLVSGLLAWAVIITEFSLGAAFLARRFIPVAIWVGIAYHTSLVLITGRTFGMFWFAATASYLAFVNWPPHPELQIASRRYGGAAAVLLRALSHPGVLAAVYAFAALPLGHQRFVAALVLACLAGFAVSVLRVELPRVWGRRGEEFPARRTLGSAGR